MVYQITTPHVILPQHSACIIVSYAQGYVVSVWTVDECNTLSCPLTALNALFLFVSIFPTSDVCYFTKVNRMMQCCTTVVGVSWALMFQTWCGSLHLVSCCVGFGPTKRASVTNWIPEPSHFNPLCRRVGRNNRHKVKIPFTNFPPLTIKLSYTVVQCIKAACNLTSSVCLSLNCLFRQYAKTVRQSVRSIGCAPMRQCAHFFWTRAVRPIVNVF